jgi:hypothetical protein
MFHHSNIDELLILAKISVRTIGMVLIGIERNPMPLLNRRKPMLGF